VPIVRGGEEITLQSRLHPRRPGEGAENWELKLEKGEKISRCPRGPQISTVRKRGGHALGGASSQWATTRTSNIRPERNKRSVTTKLERL